MRVYTIYKRPMDYPNNFVVRGYTIGEGKIFADINPHLVCDTLEEARQSISYGLVRTERSEKDALSVVETWV